MSERTQFVHDCDECVFLGHWEGHDLYVHPIGLATVIARYGNEGHDYISGVALAAVVPHLAEAMTRARARGLLPEAPP